MARHRAQQLLRWMFVPKSLTCSVAPNSAGKFVFGAVVSLSQDACDRFIFL